FLLVLVGVLLSSGETPSQKSSRSGADAPAGWHTTAPRDEIRPSFAYERNGGPDGAPCLVIKADARQGQDGSWARGFQGTGGKYYRFSALYKAIAVRLERRSIVAKIDWQDAQGRSVPSDKPSVANYLRGSIGMAETEFPTTHPAGPDGWSEVSDTYCAPSRATQAS